MMMPSLDSQKRTNNPQADRPLIASGMGLQFFLVTGLFFLWGVPNNLNDVLIRQFMTSFAISRFQAGLVQSAFYLGYFLVATPAALLMRKFGYKPGFITGLLLFGTGAFLFWPAALLGHHDPPQAAQVGGWVAAAASARPVSIPRKAGRGKGAGLCHQRVTESQVEVDRPRPAGAVGGLCNRPCSEGAPRGGGLGHRNAGLAGPSNRRAEKAGLLDSLRSADVVKLGRAVGRAGNQRHPGVICLHHGRMQLGSSRPAGGAHEGRSSSRQTQPDREEARATLVQAYVKP